MNNEVVARILAVADGLSPDRAGLSGGDIFGEGAGDTKRGKYGRISPRVRKGPLVLRM